MNKKLIALIAILTLAGATYILGYSTLFTVSSVEVIGSTKPINTGITKGQKLARVEPRAVATKLEAGSCLKSGSVKNCRETFESFSPMRVPPPFLENTD